MKKTLIALMALASVAVGDVTIGSYYTVDGVNYDAVDNFYGYTKNEIVAKSGVTCDKLAFDANSIGNLAAVALNTGAMLTSDSTLTTGTALTLNSLSILAREDNTYKGSGSTVSITLNDVTYTSSVATYGDATAGHDLITYTFGDNQPTFKLGDTLTFSFALAEGTIVDTNKIPAAALKGLSGTATIFNGGWQGAFQLSTEVVQAEPSIPSVPEPATATLSLLALAGLAARRRRK